MAERPSGPAQRRKSEQRVQVDPVAGLAGSIAHDFSNLLIVIRNASAFLRDDLPRDHPLQEYVKQLIDAGDRAATLTRQLQAIGQSTLVSPEFVSPGLVVRELTESLRRLVPENIDLRISSRSRVEVAVDVAQFQIAVISLVTFAADQAPSHSTVSVAVNDLQLEDEKLSDGEVVSGRFVAIIVVHPGVDQETSRRTKRFSPRLSGRTTPGGTDLRLATVRGIVTQSSGHVDVSTEGGQSTTWRLLLPIVANPVTAESQPRPRKSRARLSANSADAEVVLVVEDETSVRATVRAALEYHGYTVVEAKDGAEARLLMGLYNVAPNLILTDLVMPNLTGRELVESLALEGHTTSRILLMSGYTDDDLEGLGAATRTHPFIRKPFTHDELAAKVREVLDSE